MTAQPPQKRAIDLNCDLGEGFGRWVLTDDEGLLQVVSSANVACGFHAGDPLTMQRVCARAATLGVSVGAQVSFRDLAGFGRRRLECSPEELAADVLYQLGAVAAFCVSAGTRVRYVKPHGALYHELSRDALRAAAVSRAIVAFDAGLAVVGPPGSALLAAADAAGLRVIREGFPDRAYMADGRLVDRRQAGALIDEPGQVASRAVTMATDGRVRCLDGGSITMEVDSLCIHGDSPGAVAVAAVVRQALAASGCAVRPCA